MPTTERCQTKINAAVAIQKSNDQVALDAAVATQRASDYLVIDGLNSTVAGLNSALLADDTIILQRDATIVALNKIIYDLQHPEQPPTQRFPGDPGNSLYYGLNVNGGDPSAREAYFKKPVAIYRSYWQPTQTDSMLAVIKRDLLAGRLPFVSTKLPASWADMALGKQDAWVHDQLIKMALVDGPIWYCWNHEPTDDGQSSADYKAMYQHLYPMVRDLTSNVAVVPILQSAPFDTTVYGNPATLGEWIDPSCIDIMGIDTYCHWYPGGPNKWRDPATVASFMDVLKTKFGKPIAIAEYGVRTDPASPGKASQWMFDFHDILVARDDIVAMSFFDSSLNVNDGGTPWTLDYGGDPERLLAFKALMSAAGSVYLP